MDKKEVSGTLKRLWPAVQGSITEVQNTCIKKDCEVCRRGDKHPATILTYWDDKSIAVCMFPKRLLRN